MVPGRAQSVVLPGIAFAACRATLLPLGHPQVAAGRRWDLLAVFVADYCFFHFFDARKRIFVSFGKVPEAELRLGMQFDPQWDAPIILFLHLC